MENQDLVPYKCWIYYDPSFDSILLRGSNVEKVMGTTRIDHLLCYASEVPDDLRPFKIEHISMDHLLIIFSNNRKLISLNAWEKFLRVHKILLPPFSYWKDLEEECEDIEIELPKKISYTIPDFDRIWENNEMESPIRDYFKVIGRGKLFWEETCYSGYVIRYSMIKEEIENWRPNDTLDVSQKEYFEELWYNGEIEMPIVLRAEEEWYTILKGRLDLLGVVKKGQDPKIWVLDVVR